MSQETAAEATNVSAATEEQSASLSEVSESIAHLTSLAEELDDQVSDFEVGDDAADVDAAVETPGSVAQTTPGTTATTAAADER